MTRLVGRRVTVSVDSSGNPCRVADRAAEPLMSWMVEQDWWSRPVIREYWRVLLGGSLLAEIYKDHLEEAWYLERIYD